MDSETIIAAIKRDPDALDRMSDWLCDELIDFYSLYYKRGLIDQMIQNTVRDVFTKMATEAPLDPVAFRGWVLGFAGIEARRAASDQIRAKARGAKLMLQAQVPPPAPPDPHDVTLEHEQLEILDLCIPKLSANYRQAIEHQLEGGDYKSLAELAGITEGAARVRLTEAKRQLRTIVQEERLTRLCMRTPA